MKKIAIGLFGALVNAGNLGCCALTYSLIKMLDSIAVNNKYIFIYKIFERNAEKEKVNLLADQLGIARERFISCKSARFIRFYKFKENAECKREISSCDFVIDLTQGDSFTDIYGIERFVSYTLDKIAVEQSHVPLILGPQTYGPFNNGFFKPIAKRVINKATSVFSRDQVSKDFLKALGVKKEIYVGTDLAFGLPYKAGTRVGRKVGVNISGLLWPDKFENSKMKFTLACDYKLLIERILQYLQKEHYEVYLVSHVEADYEACKTVHQDHPYTQLVEPFPTPVEAKSFISEMSLFIGSRMHATIAALSSETSVIPMAYSRKFQGLFDNLGYRYVIGLLKGDTDECYEMFRSDMKALEDMKFNTQESESKANEKYLLMKSELEKQIKNIICSKKG